MKTCVLIFFLFCVILKLPAQQKIPDSLYYQLNKTDNDTLKLFLLEQICEGYLENNWDSARYYGEKSLLSAKQMHFSIMEAYMYDEIGYIDTHTGNFSQALIDLLTGIDIGKNPENDNNPNNNINKYFTYFETNNSAAIRSNILGWCHLHLGHLYGSVGNYTEQIKQYFTCESYWYDTASLTYIFMNLGNAYLNINKPDSALYYETLAYKMADPDKFSYYFKLLKLLGIIYTDLGNYSLAKKYFYQALTTDHSSNKNGIYSSLALLYLRTGIKDSALYFANLGNQLSISSKSPEDIIYAQSLLVQVYESLRMADSALKYQKQLMILKDSVFGAQKLLSFQQVYFDDQARKKEIEDAKMNFKNKLRIYALDAGLLIMAIATVFLIRNIRVRKKTNRLLQDQKKDVELSLARLKSTQAQLIQSEKMASLGELTAGIAHEIQNPLNFVNNFSEVNKELIDETSQANEAGKPNEVKELLSTLKDNEEKINHHGKRADAIVKGMLQHSRSSTGAKEPTDISALADEYLRLAFHGLRAKDNSFNATMKTDFDNAIGKINIIPQDIGRVLLNLYNNAFYAVSEKQKQLVKDLSGFQNLTGLAPYEPTVTVSTKKSGNQVSISVSDNGSGIPQKIVDKIFQPFFTTKPTGQGTGLGLSLSYDIVKAHGGEIKVQTKEGEGSEFTIQLPLA